MRSILKYILFFAVNIVLINVADCQKKDTTIIYLENRNGMPHKVSTLDSCDFFRMIMPADSGDDQLNINEFYKNGKIKLAGKCDSKYYYETGIEMFNGNCVTFFPNGKKQSIVNYVKNVKDGDEYLFYPNGTVFCNIKHELQKGAMGSILKNWECYDYKGVQICTEGNGEWIIYEDDFSNPLRGPVRNGIFEGDWHGVAPMKSDSIKYIIKYNNGLTAGGIGFAKDGTAYPFKNEIEPPSIENFPIEFMRKFHGYFKMPKIANRRKMLSDTSHISFIIEKDGRLTNPEIVGLANIDTLLQSALQNALDQYKGETARTYFGIPLRSRFTIAYKETDHGEDSRKIITIGYKEEILDN